FSKKEITDNKAKNNLKNKNLRQHAYESLDHTFVPSFVPQPFIIAVKPFFAQAKEICTLWERATIAYRTMNFEEPIDTYLPTIIQAFKETVYRSKKNKIKTSFIQYYYG